MNMVTHPANSQNLVFVFADQGYYILIQPALPRFINERNPVLHGKNNVNMYLCKCICHVYIIRFVLVASLWDAEKAGDVAFTTKRFIPNGMKWNFCFYIKLFGMDAIKDILFYIK